MRPVGHVAGYLRIYDPVPLCVLFTLVFAVLQVGGVWVGGTTADWSFFDLGNSSLEEERLVAVLSCMVPPLETDKAPSASIASTATWAWCTYKSIDILRIHRLEVIPVERQDFLIAPFRVCGLLRNFLETIIVGGSCVAVDVEGFFGGKVSSTFGCRDPVTEQHAPASQHMSLYLE